MVGFAMTLIVLRFTYIKALPEVYQRYSNSQISPLSKGLIRELSYLNSRTRYGVILSMMVLTPFIRASPEFW